MFGDQEIETSGEEQRLGRGQPPIKAGHVTEQGRWSLGKGLTFQQIVIFKQ